MTRPEHPAAARARPERIRHEIKRRMLEVVRADTLTPRMRRIVLGGDALEGFNSAAADDHLKLFLPAPGQDRPILPTIGPNGPFFPQDVIQPIARDYTPRRFDARAGELTIDFVLHGHGPATSWAAHARPGQVVGIGGPRSSMPIADDFACYLLAGDETALPAIGRRLEELPTGARAIVLAEIADMAEARYLPGSADHSIHWLPRNGMPSGRPDLMLRGLQELDWPAGDTHLWMAGESGVIRRLRAYLVAERGVEREDIRASGYWKAGDAASHEQIDADPISIPAGNPIGNRELG